MNVVSLHQNKVISIADFEQTLDLSDLTLAGQKNRLNTWSEISNCGYTLPIMAMDNMTNIDGQCYFASTFEGAAALSTLLTVHDHPEISALGPAIFDGHVLWLSLPELVKRSFNEMEMVAFLRDGCGACAAHALGIERPTSWTYVDPERLRPIVDAMDVGNDIWAPNPAQDAYRYASALQHLCAPLQDIPIIEQSVLDSGVVNQEWGSVLNAWNTFHTSKEWNTRLAQKSGATEVGRLLGNLLNMVESPNTQELFVQLVVRTFTFGMSQDEKIQVIKTADNIVEQQEQIESIVNALSTSNQSNCFAQTLAGSRVRQNMLKYIWYGRYLNSNDERDLMVSVATSVTGSPKDMKSELATLLATASGIYSADQIDILTQYHTAVLQKIDSEPDDGQLVKNILCDFRYISVARDEPWRLSALEHMQTLVRLIDERGLGFNANFDVKQTSDLWSMLMHQINKISDKDVTALFSNLIRAGQKHDDHFASHLCAVLLKKNTFNTEMVNCLFEHGADWNYAPHDKTLAQLILEKSSTTLALKTQARRICESRLGENVTVFVRKKT